MGSNPGLGKNGIIADTGRCRKEGLLPRLAPASMARMTERLSRRKHEVLMPLCRYKRQNIIRKEKGSVAS